MTKKHFEAIALALSQARAQSKSQLAKHMHPYIDGHHDRIVAHLNMVFSADNGNFDALRFERAAS